MIVNTIISLFSFSASCVQTCQILANIKHVNKYRS